MHELVKCACVASKFSGRCSCKVNPITAAAANVRHVMGAEQRAAAATERPTLFFPDLHNIHFLVYGGKVLNVYSR